MARRTLSLTVGLGVAIWLIFSVVSGALRPGGRLSYHEELVDRPAGPRLGVTPFPGRGRTFPSQALQKHLRDGDGTVVHLHVRKSGGGQLRQMMVDSGLYTREGNSCELGNSAFAPMHCFSQDAIFVTTVRDPLSRFESDFNWEGPNGSEPGAADIWASRLQIPQSAWKTATEELYRVWMRWPKDMAVLDEVPPGLRPRGVYIPNYATMMLGANYSLHTDGGFTRPAASGEGLTCHTAPCTPTKIKRVTDEEEMKGLLANAKRALVSLDLALPMEELSAESIPFFDYVTARTGKILTPGQAVHKNNHKVHFPQAIQDQILADNWADQELYEFTQQLYQAAIASDFFLNSD